MNKAVPLAWTRRSLPGLSGFFLVVYSLLGAGAPAVSSIRDRTRPQQQLKAESFVIGKLASWQKRLHLENWNLAIRIVPLEALKPNTLGHVRWDRDRRSAEILVLDPAGYRLPYRQALDDIETTIVHELLHIQLSGLPRNERTKPLEEEVVRRLSETLLQLEHR